MRAEKTNRPSAQVLSPMLNRSSVLVAIVLVAVFSIGAVLLVHWWKGVSYGDLTRDPNVIAGTPFYFGFLSQLGLFFWAGASAVCAFSGAVVAQSGNRHQVFWFLSFSALISSVLGLDDAYQLHENFFPGIGVDQNLVLSLYVLAVMAFLVRFRALILKTDFPLLGVALTLFGISVIYDFFTADTSQSVIIEDGSKFVGILVWFAYFVRVCYDAIDASKSQE